MQNLKSRGKETLFQETRIVRSILWGQGESKFIIEQLLGNSPGIRVHTSDATSRENLLELALCIRPDLLVFETSISGQKKWSELVSLTRNRVSEMGLIAVLNDLNNELIQDLALGQVDGIVKFDKIHLEIPQAIRAYQRSEIFLNPQVTRIFYSFLRESSSGQQKQQDIGLLKALTNRELEVLTCLSKGMNYKAISEKLFVSSSTVKTHVNNIFTKLNVNDRTQAVLYGLKHGIDQINIGKNNDQGSVHNNTTFAA